MEYNQKTLDLRKTLKSSQSCDRGSVFHALVTLEAGLFLQAISFPPSFPCAPSMASAEVSWASAGKMAASSRQGFRRDSIISHMPEKCNSNQLGLPKGALCDNCEGEGT